MSRSTYSKMLCYVCGDAISSAGFAQYNHKMKHIREGIMEKRVSERLSGYIFEIVDRERMFELYPYSPLRKRNDN